MELAAAFKTYTELRDNNNNKNLALFIGEVGERRIGANSWPRLARQGLLGDLGPAGPGHIVPPNSTSGNILGAWPERQQGCFEPSFLFSAGRGERPPGQLGRMQVEEGVQGRGTLGTSKCVLLYCSSGCNSRARISAFIGCVFLCEESPQISTRHISQKRKRRESIGFSWEVFYLKGLITASVINNVHIKLYTEKWSLGGYKKCIKQQVASYLCI